MEKRKRYCSYFHNENPQSDIPASTKAFKKKRQYLREPAPSNFDNSSNADLVSDSTADDYSSDGIATLEISDSFHGSEGEDDHDHDDYDVSSDDSINSISDDGDITGDEELDDDLSNDNDNLIQTNAIYTNCPITLDESAVLIFQYALSEKISVSSLMKLMKLIRAHLPSDCNFFNSLYQMKKYFERCSNSSIDVATFCHKCTAKCDDGTGDCPKCGKKPQLVSQLVRLPVVNQIQSFFHDPAFCDLINYRFTREKKSGDNIEDVYDGTIYKSLFDNNGILSDKFSLSLKVNTDGVSIFKSSNYHLWPVYFQINELPPEKRTLSKYRILAGLWCGRKKPKMDVLFSSIVEELKCLEEDGMEFSLHDGSSIKSKVTVISGHFDTPAKDDFLNKVHHNGKFGCSFCMDEGKTSKSGKGYVHTYPYNRMTLSGYGTQRTCESLVQNALDAEALRKPVMGIKGKSPFMNLNNFQIVNSIGVDYMHTVCLGVAKRLLNIWTDKSNKSQPWYIGHRLCDLDERLVRICPPNTVTRTPRSIAEHLSHFKASELKMWLLHYGPVCLRGILPATFYNHFLYLCRGIYILLSASISPTDLDESERCLKTFCLMMEDLYGEKYITINVHLLLHTVESVRQLGPLWTSSCFSFEDYNGQLTDFIHGTQSVHQQIMTAVLFYQELPYYIRKFQQNDIAADLLSELQNKHQTALKEKIGEIYVLGAKKNQEWNALTPTEKAALHDVVPTTDGIRRMATFTGVFMNGSVFRSQLYKRAYRRNSYTIKFKSNQQTQMYGHIKYFLKVEQGENAETYALIQPLKVVENICNNHISLLQIAKVQYEDHLIAVQTANISMKCVFMESEHMFISEMPNIFESD